MLTAAQPSGADQPQRTHAGPLLVVGEDADHACGARSVRRTEPCGRDQCSRSTGLEPSTLLLRTSVPYAPHGSEGHSCRANRQRRAVSLEE
jgi:hypothetical protein